MFIGKSTLNYCVIRDIIQKGSILYINLQLDMDIRVGKRYRLGRRIGFGSFGNIFIGTLFSS